MNCRTARKFNNMIYIHTPGCVFGAGVTASEVCQADDVSLWSSAELASLHLRSVSLMMHVSPWGSACIAGGIEVMCEADDVSL